jgi:cell division protease FtsH
MPDKTIMPDRNNTPNRSRSHDPDRKALIPKGPRLADLHGMSAAKTWGEALAQDLEDYIAGRITWSEVDPGALLHGDPGTGKTMFAKALAATCGVPLIATSYAEWQRTGDGHLGHVLEAMHGAFQCARQAAPAILFIDEIEAVSSREARGGNHRWYTGIITALNEELAGLASREGVVVIAAANYPDRIDPALLRAGRLDTKIFFPHPAAAELRGIIRFHLGNNLIDTDLGSLADAAVGSTGADVEKLVRVARRRARKLNRPLRLPDLMAVLGERLQDLPRSYLECIAIHEAGHATAAIVLKVSRNVSVSLFHLGKGGAATFFDPQIEAVTRKVVERRIAVALAGRAAEEVLRNEVTAGAGGSDTSDLGVANSLAFWAVARWGLAERERLKWVDSSPEEIVANHPKLAKEAYAMLEAAYARALRLIRQRAPQVHAIANALLKRRALAHADILALLENPQPGAGQARTKRSGRKRG